MLVYSTFENNTSVNTAAEHSSALVAFRFPTDFKGSNRFIGNKGGGITLLNTIMRARGSILFLDNVATFGGGLAMDDRCLVSDSVKNETREFFLFIVGMMTTCSGHTMIIRPRK